MRIAIYHGSFATGAGGSEVFALRAAAALKEMGHEVDLYTSVLDKDELLAACEYAGVCIFPKIINIIKGYQAALLDNVLKKRLFSSLWIINEYRKAYRELAAGVGHFLIGYDVTIAMQSSSNLYNMYLVPRDIAHFHSPIMVTGLAPLADYISAGASPLMELYRRLVRSLEYKAFAETACSAAKTGKVTTNSTWTKEALIKLNLPLLGVVPEPCRPRLIRILKGASVIYSPIDYETYSSRYDLGTKDNFVLTVSRYSSEKNLWSIIYIASKVPEAHFVIAGTTKDIDSVEALARLEFLIDKLKVKNVTLERDVPRKRLVDLYLAAKVYLHPLYVEHFGRAIAEGAAAGAVPVVYRDGGGWTDIASRIDPMLGYTNIDGAASIVRSLLSNKDLWLRLSRRSVEVAANFSWDNFKRRLDAAVREAYELKRRTPHS